jgi:uncharacterized protein YheU (UPF0270 family)
MELDVTGTRVGAHELNLSDAVIRSRQTLTGLLIIVYSDEHIAIG